MAKKKKQSAGSKLSDDGKSLVWATFDEAEKSAIRTAAGITGKPMSQFVRDAALAEAGKILEKFKRNS